MTTRFWQENRDGVRYFLHAGPRKGQYVMARQDSRRRVLTRLPAGYETWENAKGRIYVRRVQPGQIQPTEASLIRSTLARLRPRGYIAATGPKHATILASALDRKSFGQCLDAEFADGFAAALEETLTRRYGHELAELFRAKRENRDGCPARPTYYPLLRFELADNQKRLFLVKRIYFSGDQDWLTLEELSLPAALMKYIPHLERDSFFDLL